MIRGVGQCYEQRTGDRPPGFLETLLIVRAVLGVVLLLLAVMLLVVTDAAVTVGLFFVHPALALVTLVPTAAAAWIYAPWEQRRFRPPGT
jgi:thiol:disulfide interchange protein